MHRPWEPRLRRQWRSEPFDQRTHRDRAGVQAFFDDALIDFIIGLLTSMVSVVAARAASEIVQ